MYRNHRRIGGLLRSCLLLLLAACGSTTSPNAGATPASAFNQRPTATPFTTVTPLPTQTAKLTVTFGCKTGVKEGFYADPSHAFACARTLPGASLTIAVLYCNGTRDQSTSLKGTFTADSTGYYEWDWKPLAVCQNGPAYWSGKVTVTAMLNGQTASSDSVFQAN